MCAAPYVTTFDGNVTMEKFLEIFRAMEDDDIIVNLHSVKRNSDTFEPEQVMRLVGMGSHKFNIEFVEGGHPLRKSQTLWQRIRRQEPEVDPAVWRMFQAEILIKESFQSKIASAEDFVGVFRSYIK